jgi:hypothetical protein
MPGGDAARCYHVASPDRSHRPRDATKQRLHSGYELGCSLVGPQHLAGALHTLYLIEPAGIVGHHGLTPFSTACARRCCSQRLDCPATGNSSAALALAVMAAASPSACDSYRASVEQAAEPECEALSSGQVHRTAWCCPRAGRCRCGPAAVAERDRNADPPSSVSPILCDPIARGR